MPRRDIPFLPDQYYHFYNRGNNRQAIFFERANYLYFLKGIKTYLCGQVEILAYCLMPTHYHILGRVRPKQTSEFLQNSEISGGEVPGEETCGETSEVLKTSEVLDQAASEREVSKAVSFAMQKFGISYTKAINKRFSRVGALFQGQFQAKPIQHYNHLLNLCLYIHANPVKDGLVAVPETWEFSNYLEWLNLRAGTLVNREFVSENFGTPAEYQNLVRDYLKTRNLPEEVRKYLQDLES